MRAWRLAALAAFMRSARIVMVHAVLEVSSFVRQLAQRATRQCCVGHARAQNIREVAAPAAHGHKRQAGQIAVFVGLQQDMQRLAHVGATGRFWEQTVRHQSAFLLGFVAGVPVSRMTAFVLWFWMCFSGVQMLCCTGIKLVSAMIELTFNCGQGLDGVCAPTGPVCFALGIAPGLREQYLVCPSVTLKIGVSEFSIELHVLPVQKIFHRLSNVSYDSKMIDELLRNASTP